MGGGKRGTMSLTSGCIQRIYNQDSDVSAAVVQVLDVKKLGAQGGTGAPRYRLVLSDGVHYQQAMLATQLNDTIDMENLKPNTLVKLDEVICNVVQDRRIIIVLGMTPMD